MNSGSKVYISPPSQKITLDPGKTYKGSFIIGNNGADTFFFSLDTIAYGVTNNTYIPNYEIESSYTQLSNWITILSEKSGYIAPKGTTEVRYSIKVPDDAPGGGQYAAIAVSVPNNEAGPVQTISRPAFVLYATVNGETNEQGKILNNRISNFVLGEHKITASSVVENTGNTHSDAVYSLKVYRLGSDEELYSTNPKLPVTHTILPETKRYNVLSWDEAPEIGLFTAEQTIEYMGETSTVSQLVIICPVWLAVVILTAIVTLILTVVFRRHRTLANRRKTSRAKR